MTIKLSAITFTLLVQDSDPCNSYFTVWDKKTRDRGTFTFAKKSENADLKMLLCTGCDTEIGEVDAWYGVKCSCGDLVVPGYQILKVSSEFRFSSSIEVLQITS